MREQSLNLPQLAFSRQPGSFNQRAVALLRLQLAAQRSPMLVLKCAVFSQRPIPALTAAEGNPENGPKFFTIRNWTSRIAGEPVRTQHNWAKYRQREHSWLHTTGTC